MSHSPARCFKDENEIAVYRFCLKLSRKKAKKASTVKDELLQEKCAVCGAFQAPDIFHKGSF